SSTGRKYSNRKRKFVEIKICQLCGKEFAPRYWKRAPYPKFCGTHCTGVALGRKPTSHKASRGKYGIRQDIS
ncbi:MAG: hypothetical protein V1489_01430, partial [Candidatus Liptonbacteria bacterium]